MTQFIKKHISKFIYTSLGALLMSAFGVGTIWKEHLNLMSDVQLLKIHEESSREKYHQFIMNDSLLSIRLGELSNNQNVIAQEQKRSNKILYRIANKLHVEIPAE